MVETGKSCKDTFGFSDFLLRVSDLFRISTFGFRTSAEQDLSRKKLRNVSQLPIRYQNRWGGIDTGITGELIIGPIRLLALGRPRRRYMDLSAEQFIEILSAGNPAESTQDAQDMRRSPRTGLRTSATIIPLSEGSHPTAISVQVRDLSPAGIGFLHAQKMKLDEQFALILSRRDDTPSVVLCAVAFWQPLARDLFATGARFTRILRDGGDPPLPLNLEAPSADLADEIERLHRRAS